MKIFTYNQVWDLWEQYKSAIQAYLQKRLSDTEQVNDLSQEVLLKVYSSCCSNREIQNVRSWLFQISHNAMIDHLKDSQKRNSMQLEKQGNESTDTVVDLSQYVDALIDCLPSDYAVPLRMADLENMEQKDIAQKLGLGLSATKSRIQRGRIKLREQILECFHIELGQNGSPIDFSLKDHCKDWESIPEKKTENCCVF